MDKYIKKITIDIDKKNYNSIPSVQYDNGVRYLHINLINEGKPIVLKGCSVKIGGIKPDGFDIFNSCTIIDEENGLVEVNLTEQINAADGTVRCELKIYNATGVLTTKEFNIEVSKSVTRASNITSSNEFTALTEALAKAQAIDNKAEKAEVEKLSSQLDTKANELDLKILENRMDSFTSLSEGSSTGDAELIDGRIVNGKTYENIGSAIRAVSKGKAIEDNSIKYEKLEEAFNNIFNFKAFDNIVENRILEKYYKWSNNSYLTNLTGSICDKVSVSEGQKYIISGRSGLDLKLVIFLKDGNPFSCYPSENEKSSADHIDEEFIIPEGVTEMRVNSYSPELFEIKLENRVLELKKGSITSENKYSTLKWVIFGDSYSDASNSYASKRYFYFIAEDLGIPKTNIKNLAVSGSGYKRTNSNFVKRSTSSSMPTEFDIVTIFGSGNDCNIDENYNFGNATDTTTDTICGCVNVLINNILDKNPKAKILIITPTPWSIYPNSEVNNRMELYANKLIEVCRYRGIKCLDLYHSSGLIPTDARHKILYYENDITKNVHPNDEGHRLYLTPPIREAIKTII